MQQGNLNVNWNTNSSFLVYIQNDDIFSYDGQKIGVVNKKYNDIEQGLIKCKEKLIELGVIKVPKTQEEIIKEQSEMIEKQQALLDDLITKIGGKDGFDTISFEPDTKGKTTTSKGNGDKSDKKNKSATD